MAQPTLTFLSREELRERGFYPDYPHWYKGSRGAPREILSYHLVENLAGQVVRPLEVDSDEDRWEVLHKGRVYTKLRSWMFREGPKHSLLRTPDTLRIGGRQVASYNGVCFKFSCSLENASPRVAQKVARWVLERTRT
jgi:hypothetical protein